VTICNTKYSVFSHFCQTIFITVCFKNTVTPRHNLWQLVRHSAYLGRLCHNLLVTFFGTSLSLWYTVTHITLIRFLQHSTLLVVACEPLRHCVTHNSVYTLYGTPWSSTASLCVAFCYAWRSFAALDFLWQIIGEEKLEEGYQACFEVEYVVK
jgi:hypothetical protein